jgi:hypothetical protein
MKTKPLINEVHVDKYKLNDRHMADFLQLFTAEYNSIPENLLNKIDLSINNAVNHIINI